MQLCGWCINQDQPAMEASGTGQGKMVFQRHPGKEQHHNGIWLPWAPFWPKALHGDLGSRQSGEGKITLRGIHFLKTVYDEPNELSNLFFPFSSFRNKNETFLFMCYARIKGNMARSMSTAYICFSIKKYKHKSVAVVDQIWEDWHFSILNRKYSN